MVKNDARKVTDTVALIDLIFVNEGRKRIIGAACSGIGFTLAALGIIILTTPID